MVTYAANELISSSDLSKKFGSYLAQIRENSINKLAILKNNKIEAVMVSKDDYERMKEAYDLVEHMEISNMIEKRISKPYKTISLEDMAEQHNIDNLDEMVADKRIDNLKSGKTKVIPLEQVFTKAGISV